MADIPGDLSTTASLHIGDTVSDTLDLLGDHDWFRLDVDPYREITITLNGIGLEDPYVRIVDASGNVIAENDDSGPGRNALVSFMVPSTGTYYIDVGAWNEESQGSYQLSIAPYTLPPEGTVDDFATQLVSGYWEGSSHRFDVAPGGTITVDLTGLTDTGRFLATAALDTWTDLIGVHFVQVSSGANITFDDDEAGGFTEGVWSDGITTSAHVNVSQQWLDQVGAYYGSETFEAYVHEIGHALGLGHAGNYNFTGTYPYDAIYRNDNVTMSVMSYFGGSNIVTPMMADIVAISQLYGLSTTTRPGDTTYGFHSTADRPWFDATQYTQVVYTIYDSAGNDTLDYSGFYSDQLIDLTPGSSSNVGFYTGNVSIARGVIIENAIGGAGSDTLMGNSANNVLNGGGGFNTVSYENATAGVTIDTSISGPQNTIGAGVDTLLNFTRVIGSSFGDTLIGGDGSQDQRIYLRGADGDDTLVASASGGDLSGDSGNDTLIGSNSRDSLDGGIGNDRIVGGGGDDTIYGDPWIYGQIGDDVITGGAGNDYLIGGGGNDVYIDTAAGLNGDTLSDFGPGDRIVITDADPWTFTFSRSDFALDYTGGSLNLWFTTTYSLTASAALEGGVQLLIRPPYEASDDFNGDGRSDVLLRNDDGTLINWLGQFTGAFLDNAANSSVNPGLDWHVAGTGDFNGDHHADILWRNDIGNVVTLLGQPSGGFVGNVNFALNPGLDWHVVGTGDFNGDGYDDILWRNDIGTVVDLLGQSNGAFVGNVSFNLNPGLDWHVEGTGDFNGDGRDDILWRNDIGNVVTLLGAPNGSFVGNVNFQLNPGLDWHIVGTGDFNGDGRDDILWRNDIGNVVDLLGQSNGSFIGNVNFQLNPGLDWHIVGTGDYDGDGRDDILWRNDAGTITDLLGQPDGTFHGNIANLNVNPGADWHVEPPSPLV